MKKILKNIGEGFVFSLMEMGSYVSAILIFIQVYSTTGYLAIMKFIGAILLLVFAVFISWFIGYSSDCVKPLIQNGDKNI